LWSVVRHQLDDARPDIQAGRIGQERFGHPDVPHLVVFCGFMLETGRPP